MAEQAITLDPRNANKGTERGEYMVEHSLRTYGAGRGPVVDKHNVVIAGNKTVSKAMELGIPIEIIESDGKTLYVIKRTDLDLATDPAAMELGLIDNRSAQVGIDLDPVVVLALQEAGADLSAMWYDGELLGEEATITEGLTDPDAVPDPPKEPITKPGDLWQLGRHRLLCGDSTVVTDVERLLDGNVPTLMITDPPYGVDYEPDWRSSLDSIDRATNAVSNDDRIDWSDAWSLVLCDVAYCWHADRHASAVQVSLESAGYVIRSQIIWAKPHFALSRGHYHWQHEPCWYAVRKGATASWIGDHAQSTVWSVDNGTFQGGTRLAEDTATGHGTQKPVELMARPLRNHAGDVYDPFVGSGTTLIAAEQLGRRCFAMDIDPVYVDASVNRWQNFTGQQATLMSGQNPHERQ